MSHRTFAHRLWPIPGLSLLICCTVIEESYEILAEQIEGAWVFYYSEPPLMNMQALHSGEVLVVDGCLEIDGLAVIWYEDQLATVEEALERVGQGESVSLRFGGGGSSLDEGASLEELPAEIYERCDPRGVWWASSGQVEFL
jgi:hypothetical protein